MSDTHKRFGKMVRDVMEKHPQPESFSIRIEPWVEALDTDVQIRHRYAYKVTFKEVPNGYDVKIREEADIDPEVASKSRRLE